MVLMFSLQIPLQPQIAGPLGPIANVSAPMQQVLERSDRIQPQMSISNLVCYYRKFIIKFGCYLWLELILFVVLAG